MNESGNQQPKVVFRLSHMGDVALTTGVLAYWHETHGDTFIVITRAMNTPLLENHPAVERVIALENADLKTGAWIRKSRSIAKKHKGHTLIDLHATLRSQILSFFWKGKVLRYPKFSVERRLFDKTHKEKYRKKLEATNVPQRYAMAYGTTPPAQEVLTPRLYLSDKERTRARHLLKTIERQKPLVTLHPYATHASKEWPRANWEALIAFLDEAGMEWIIIGRDNRPVLENHERDFTNSTNLRETCALFAEADILVTGDSGPMHLAAGVDTPVLAMFGPTVKAWGFFPPGAKDRVLERALPCRPCSLHGGKGCDKQIECLASITPEEVMRNILEMVERP